MDAAQMLKFLRQAQQHVGASGLALRCDCANLETVYVLERRGELAVTDRGETFAYLERSGDTTYGSVDLERAKAICERHDAKLEDQDPEQDPQVVRLVEDKPLRAVIDAVSEVVDELFSAALDRGRS